MGRAHLPGIELDDVIHPPVAVDEDAEPIFVLGCVRSGLRVVQEALEAAGIPSSPSVSTGGLLQRMLQEVDRQYQNLDAAYLADTSGNLIANTEEAGVRNFVVGSAIHALHGGAPDQRAGRWSERCPDFVRTAPMVRSVPELARIYPRARFLYVARRGIECVLSCHRNFGNHPFQHYCWVWQDAIHAWGAARQQVPGRFLEIRQHHIALEPDRVARDVAALLDLDHSVAATMAEVFRSRRPAQSGFRRDDRWIGLDETTWAPWQKKLFVDLCKSMMDAAGYPLEGRALADPQPLEIFHPEGGAGVQLHELGSAGFRPGAEGGVEVVANRSGEPPAAVRFLGVPLAGEDRMTALIEVPAEAAGPLLLRARLEDAERRSVAHFECELAPGEAKTVEVDFPARTGWHDLVIAVEAASDSTGEGSVAVWRTLRLHHHETPSG